MSVRLSAILFLILFGCKDLQAQTRLTDSLQQVLKLHPASDSDRLIILNDLAYYYRETNPSKGIVIADSAIILATRLKDEKRLASACNYKGLNYASMGSDSIAIAWFEKSLAIHRKNDYRRGIASALHNMGISYSNMSRYAEAMDCQQQAFDICKELDNKDAMAVTLNSMGVIYLYLSDYTRALSYYFQALKIHEEKKDSFNIAIEYTNIGLVYHHASNFEKAFQYQNAAVKIFEKTGNEYNLQNTFGNIGNLYLDSGNIEKSLEYYSRALTINKKLENQNGIASVYENMGTAFYKKNDYLNSYNYLEDALAIYTRINNSYGAGQAINNLVKIYLNADDGFLKKIKVSPSERLSKAQLLQRDGIQKGIISGNLEIQRDGWESISNIFSREKNFDKAFEAYKTFILLRDSIFNHAREAEITRLTMEYAFDKRETAENEKRNKEKVLAKAALEKQKIIKEGVIGLAILLLLGSIAGFVLYKKKRDAEEKEKDAHLRAEVIETKMKALRAQMNPHFIFNCLNSISEFINRNDKKAADYYLSKFAKLIRMVLENSEMKEIPLSEELKILGLYMDLEAMRLNQKFSYEIIVDKKLNPEDVLVPPLLLQPYVENSIWHGIAPKAGNGHILIDIREKEDMIQCVVEDNGVGQNIKPDEGKDHKSFGTLITSSRITLLNKLNKTNASVKYLDKDPGRRVEIKLPLVLS